MTGHSANRFYSTNDSSPLRLAAETSAKKAASVRPNFEGVQLTKLLSVFLQLYCGSVGVLPNRETNDAHL
jgi:hypothetical protein